MSLASCSQNYHQKNFNFLERHMTGFLSSPPQLTITINEMWVLGGKQNPSLAKK